MLIDFSLESKPTSFNEIPIVDVGSLFDNNNPLKVAHQIGEICENIGFLYIKNHGVSQALIAEAYALTIRHKLRDFWSCQEVE
jgi:isopenicillin N synthase-like dioxygenase